MAEEEASSGGHLRRDGQVGRGEEEQARGVQAALAVPLRHGQGGGRLCGLLATDTDGKGPSPGETQMTIHQNSFGQMCF